MHVRKQQLLGNLIIISNIAYIFTFFRLQTRCNRYWIRLQISDHTATTTCSIFDDEAKKMLKMTITDLLDSLNGKSEEIPKVIQQLCGKTLIFRFMLKEQNLTEGKEYYLVKKTFEPDEKLEFQYSNHQAENVRLFSLQRLVYSFVQNQLSL